MNQQLAIIQMTKVAGFTLREIQTLLHGFSDDEPPSARWKALAVQKLPEIEALIERAQRMKFLLEEGLDCECLSLDECMLIGNYEPNTQSHTTTV